MAPKTLLLLALVYLVVISIAFLIPGRAIPTTQLPLDKVVHIGIHAVLLFVWALYFFKKNDNTLTGNTLLLIGVACFLYGIIIEVLQESLVALRHSDFLDLVANSIGILLGAIVFYKAKHYFKNQK
ncbi:MAG: hypothetical protein CMC70_11510 [Flavobacteriaceae bacterium]|nr:hypothetical protein [Flavobacteriaceae bacterium]